MPDILAIFLRTVSHCFLDNGMQFNENKNVAKV